MKKWIVYTHDPGGPSVTVEADYCQTDAGTLIFTTEGIAGSTRQPPEYRNTVRVFAPTYWSEVRQIQE